jgi:hypothetical protein
MAVGAAWVAGAVVGAGEGVLDEAQAVIRNAAIKRMDRKRVGRFLFFIDVSFIGLRIKALVQVPQAEGVLLGNPVEALKTPK